MSWGAFNINAKKRFLNAALPTITKISVKDFLFTVNDVYSNEESSRQNSLGCRPSEMKENLGESWTLRFKAWKAVLSFHFCPFKILNIVPQGQGRSRIQGCKTQNGTCAAFVQVPQSPCLWKGCTKLTSDCSSAWISLAHPAGPGALEVKVKITEVFYFTKNSACSKVEKKGKKQKLYEDTTVKLIRS